MYVIDKQYASKDIKVENDIVTITNYQNQNGIVQPASQNFSVGGVNFAATWMSENYLGPLNINEVIGYASSISGIPGSPKTLVFQIVNKRINPTFSEVMVPPGNTFTFGGEETDGLYYGAEFMLRDSDQIFHDPVSTEFVYKLTAK